MEKFVIINHANFSDHYSRVNSLAKVDKDTGEHLEVLSREWVGLGERNTMPSMTQPDMVEPFEQLVSRFVRTGKAPNDASEGFYTDDFEDFPFQAFQLDQIDRLNMAKQFENESDAIKKRVQERRKAALSGLAKPEQDKTSPPSGSDPANPQG